MFNVSILGDLDKGYATAHDRRDFNVCRVVLLCYYFAFLLKTGLKGVQHYFALVRTGFVPNRCIFFDKLVELLSCHVSTGLFDMLENLIVKVIIEPPQ